MIRLSQQLSLIFFVLISLESCRQKNGDEISIVLKNDQATGIRIPASLLHEPKKDSVSAYLQIKAENNSVPMLGVYSVHADHIIFSSLIPLTPGMSYEVHYRNSLIGKLKIPTIKTDPAHLTEVFPSADTVPANLLKLYLQFSAPMREGEALHHIHLTDEHNDTLDNVFLDLQPELWNEERTVLTLWLDPGRIKRDLIPNQEMGNPLEAGKKYTLSISDSWKNAKGLPLQQSYKKKMTVTGRDAHIPDPGQWIINLPVAGKTQSLNIYFGEVLDYFLLLETIQITDEKGNQVEGNLMITHKETGFKFTPLQPWKTGIYHIKVGSHLEDLAGNNLNRVFDRDIRSGQKKTEQKYFEREFVVGNR